MAASEKPRPYRKRKRARSEQATRRRITEAAVELHGTLGPAKTTVTDVAKRAGVSRMTVYNHFPTEQALFVACSTHWAERNPFPDPSNWAVIDDPAERLAVALNELYGWYDLKQGMLGKVLSDQLSVPALADVMDDLWPPYLEAIVRALTDGWPARKHDRAELHAVARLAVDFNAWQILRGAGLDNDRAAAVAVRMVTRAGSDPRR
jgi:AcrR family transcriptional regulator